MSHPAQNWKCKCGRGPSLEHSVGGYCSGREVIESLEAARDRLKAVIDSWKTITDTREGLLAEINRLEAAEVLAQELSNIHGHSGGTMMEAVDCLLCKKLVIWRESREG